jgi:hypothetical protein
VGRQEDDNLWINAMTLLGNGLTCAQRHEDALSVLEAELALQQRLGAFDAVLPGLAAALPDTIVQWVMTPETISQQMDVLKTLTPEDIKRMFAEAGYMGPQEQAPH